MRARLLIPGYATPAAKPGDVLAIYATGLGATNPAIAPGLLFSGTYAETTSTPTVTVGGVKAAVSFPGLAVAGLYQIHLIAPSGLPDGTYPVIVTQSQSSSPSTTILKIAAQ